MISADAEVGVKRIAILGAGGHARETAWTLQAMADAHHNVVLAGYILRDAASLQSEAVDGPLLGDEEWLRRNRDAVDGLALGVGTPDGRLRIAANLLPEFDLSWWPVLIHPTAVYDRRTCTFSPGVMISAGAVLTVNIDMGPFSLANFGCTIGHESRLGRGTVVNPGANISGGVEIGEGVLIGTGAQVLQYLRIGHGAVVGAGAVVTRDVSPSTTVIGCPAKPVKIVESR